MITVLYTLSVLVVVTAAMIAIASSTVRMSIAEIFLVGCAALGWLASVEAYPHRWQVVTAVCLAGFVLLRYLPAWLRMLTSDQDRPMFDRRKR